MRSLSWVMHPLLRAVHRVAFRIEFKTEERKLLDHPSPNKGSVVADTASENHHSHPAPQSTMPNDCEPIP